MRPPHQVKGPCTDSWSSLVKHSGVSSTEQNMASGDSSATALPAAVQHRTRPGIALTRDKCVAFDADICTERYGSLTDASHQRPQQGRVRYTRGLLLHAGTASMPNWSQGQSRPVTPSLNPIMMSKLRGSSSKTWVPRFSFRSGAAVRPASWLAAFGCVPASRHPEIWVLRSVRGFCLPWLLLLLPCKHQLGSLGPGAPAGASAGGSPTAIELQAGTKKRAYVSVRRPMSCCRGS